MADLAGFMEAAGARFSQLELIRRGSSGDVHKAFDKEQNKEVAIKVIDLEESERPKYEPDEGESLMAKGTVEAPDTVKVKRDVQGEETVRASQGKTVTNTGWDFSIGGNQSTGTVRSNIRQPQVREES